MTNTPITNTTITNTPITNVTNKDNSESDAHDPFDQNHVNNEKFKKGLCSQGILSHYEGYVNGIHNYDKLESSHIEVWRRLFWGTVNDPDHEQLVTTNQYLEQLREFHEGRQRDVKLLPQIKTQDPLLYPES